MADSPQGQLPQDPHQTNGEQQPHDEAPESHAAEHAHDEHHHDHHHDPGFWRKYWFSTDHKVIGLQYGITALFFLFFGFCLMLLMRWQLASPGVEIPLFGALTPELYNQFGAMHGTIMVFMGIVPLAVGAFGNYVVPLQIGAIDMAFPRLNLSLIHI